MAESMEITIEYKGTLPGDSEKAIKIWEEEIRTGLERALAYLHGRISQKMPENVTGNLRGSVATEIRGTLLDLHGVIGTPAKYALTIEKGWPAGKFPNRDAIKKWARSRFGALKERAEDSRAYLIARAMYRKGFRAPYKEGWQMFEKTFKDEESVVIKILEDANARVVSRLEA